MYYEDFAENIKISVQKIVDERLEEGTVVIRNVIKNNSVRRKSLSILRKEQNTTPTIYLKEYYDEYKAGRELDDISKEIFEVYLAGLDRFYEKVNVRDFSSFENIKDKIFCKLVNAEKNRLLLKDIPHDIFCDLAKVYYILINEDEDGWATALIHNNHLQSWDVDEEEMKSIAFENTIREQPLSIRTMESVIVELVMNDIHSGMQLEKNDCSDDDIVTEETVYDGELYQNTKRIVREEIEDLKPEGYVGMYVVSNSCRNYGAISITYPGALEKIAQKLNSDYYIIPSSIHEVIVVPVVCNWSKGQMDAMVEDVNAQELDPIEILSDHVYIYNRYTGEIEY